jgi:hypothetical protein
MTTGLFRHVFVDTVPERLEKAVLYVSLTYATAVHLCACGCGNEVVTPFNPASGWWLTFDGKTVSLWPSIGIGGCPANRIISLTTIEPSGHLG